MRGERFGRLVYVDEAGKNGRRQRLVRCRCDCGVVGEYLLYNLLNGNTQSCGCRKREQIAERSRTHGHRVSRRSSRAYAAWCSLIARCTNPMHREYRYYGGRGITVCERWRNSFENFLEDMGEPSPGLSIDRIDNNLLVDSYSKANCRWATRSQQMRNRRPPTREKAMEHLSGE